MATTRFGRAQRAGAFAAIMVTMLSLAVGLPAAAGGFALGDIGKAKVNLGKGSVIVKATSLPVLPAEVDTGSGTFTAYLYKAYVSASTDPAVEIFIGDLYPNGKGKAGAKLKLKGDVSQLGLDQVVVVAFSKDASQSFDVAVAPIQ
jgi:hypothetical protein